MNSIRSFLKKEPVLSASAFLAFISAFLVPPSAEYLSYIDWRVIALLFSLMLVVSGLREIGVFRAIGSALLSRTRTTRSLTICLIALPFFLSMLITNDVSLITFVPFTVMILTMADKRSLLIPVIVLQTIAANLGSMLTPIGNPQNLYLYSSFSLSFGQMVLWMLPLSTLSLLLLIVCASLIRSEPINVSPEKAVILSRKKLAVDLALFLVCIGCVLKVISFPAMLLITATGILLTDRKLFRTADYGLLLTFAAFFIFIGNMQRLPVVSELIRRVIDGKEMIAGTLLSQIISNVPAAILLSGFTDKVLPLLYGVNIGGLGTLIASLASLISYRCYTGTEKAEKGKYLLSFTLYNLLFLAVLLPAGWGLIAFFGA